MGSSVPLRPDGSLSRRQLLAWGLGALVVLGAIFPLMRSLEDSPRADLTFTNGGAWAVDVDLVLPKGGSRVGLGTIGPAASVPVLEVAKPGTTWTFVFTASGHEARLTVGDQALRARRYRVAVPDALLAELARSNVPPTPH